MIAPAALLSLSALFPVVPLPIATAVFLICATLLAIGVRIYAGPALLLHYGASLLVWAAFVSLWANTTPTPGAWTLLDEALARNAPSTALGTAATLVLTRAFGLYGAAALLPVGVAAGGRTWARTWIWAICLYGALLVALLHGFIATVIATGWIVALGLWLGMGMASHVLFLLLLRWPRWREQWEALIYARVSGVGLRSAGVSIADSDAGGL